MNDSPNMRYDKTIITTFKWTVAHSPLIRTLWFILSSLDLLNTKLCTLIKRIRYLYELQKSRGKWLRAWFGVDNSRTHSVFHIRREVSAKRDAYLKNNSRLDLLSAPHHLCTPLEPKSKLIRTYLIYSPHTEFCLKEGVGSLVEMDHLRFQGSYSLKKGFSIQSSKLEGHDSGTWYPLVMAAESFLTVWMAIYSFPSIEGPPPTRPPLTKYKRHIPTSIMQMVCLGSRTLSPPLIIQSWPVLAFTPKFTNPVQTVPRPREFQVFGGPPNPLANLGPGCTLANSSHAQAFWARDLAVPWILETETNPTLSRNWVSQGLSPKVQRKDRSKRDCDFELTQSWAHSSASTLPSENFVFRGLAWLGSFVDFKQR